MTSYIQDNFEKIKDRMIQKYSIEKSHLFSYTPCIVPAWENLIDEMIHLVEEWNKNNSEKRVKFFQIKEKFGYLVVYLEIDYPGESGDKIDAELQDKISLIASKGIKICRICGKEKIETVADSRIVFKCLDHWDEKNFFTRRIIK